MRPVLSPAVRRTWRDDTTLQLGCGPGRAVVLAGLDAAARAVLPLLDGTRDLTGVLDGAAARGCDRDRALALLRLLEDAGLLLDAAERWPERLAVAERDRLAGDLASLALLHRGAGLPVLRRRDAAAVVVLGAGRVGAPLAAHLAAAGIGTVAVVDDATARPEDCAVGGLQPADAGRPRAQAARSALGRAFPSTRPGPVGRPDLVVLAEPSGDGDDAAALVRDGVPHLAVGVHDTVGVVGPLVLPGRTACVHCLGLRRTERDPGWPVVAAQRSGRPPAAPACDAVLAAAVSAQAAMQALALVDGHTPAAVDGTLELALPGWRWRRRAWQPHPDCGCRWARAG